jgi:hypothetical protein
MVAHGAGPLRSHWMVVGVTEVLNQKEPTGKNQMFCQTAAGVLKVPNHDGPHGKGGDPTGQQQDFQRSHEVAAYPSPLDWHFWFSGGGTFVHPKGLASEPPIPAEGVGQGTVCICPEGWAGELHGPP